MAFLFSPTVSHDKMKTTNYIIHHVWSACQAWLHNSNMVSLYTRYILLYNEGMIVMTQRGKMKARISCTYEVRDVLSNVAQGGNVSYDELLRYLIHTAGIDMNLTPVQARILGAQMTEDLEPFKGDDDTNETDENPHE